MYVCLWPGIAFPTCVAVNHCIGHYSPLNSDPDTTLADGDLVKMLVAPHARVSLASDTCSSPSHTLVVILSLAHTEDILFLNRSKSMRVRIETF